MWKLINWNGILSKIIFNLNRIGRFFTQDFIGVWVHCSYIISQDESVRFLRYRFSIRFLDKILKINLKNGYRSYLSLRNFFKLIERVIN
jgi:hypothetical protein